MRKGDIVLIPFPFTDLSGVKVRPALILSVHGDDVIVAFISSQTKGILREFEIAVSPSETNGLKALSRLRLDKLATLERKIVVGQLGVTDAVIQKKANILLKRLFEV